MMYGLKETHLEKIKSVFAGCPAIDRAILYGSRAKGSYREASDIDISLVGSALDLNKLLRLETELDDLLLPYQIDLSIYESIESRELIEHIERVGIVIYEKRKITAGN